MTAPSPSTTASTRLLSPAGPDQPLEPLPLAEGTVLAGDPVAGVAVLGADRATGIGGPEVGLWELTPGTVTDVESDEVFVVLGGAGSITFADGSALVLAPGVVVRLHAGDATWVVTETVRKLYVA